MTLEVTEETSEATDDTTEETSEPSEDTPEDTADRPDPATSVTSERRPPVVVVGGEVVVPVPAPVTPLRTESTALVTLSVGRGRGGVVVSDFTEASALGLGTTDSTSEPADETALDTTEPAPEATDETPEPAADSTEDAAGMMGSTAGGVVLLVGADVVLSAGLATR